MSDDNRDNNGTRTRFQEEQERENALKRYYEVRDLVGRVRSLLEVYAEFKAEGELEQQQRIAGTLRPLVEQYLAANHPVERLEERCRELLPELAALVPAAPQPPAPAAVSAPLPSPRPRTGSPSPSAEPPEPARVLITPGSYLQLENIVCVDADGTVFEQYPVLDVRTDVFKDETGKILFFTPYEAARSAEEQGCFNPSFALHCAIIAALYERRADPLHAAVLQQYKDKGNGNGGHRPNTLVDWGRQQIIHYPHDGNFPAYGGTAGINASRNRTVCTFERTGFQDQLLAEALRRPNYHRYIRNLTGLPDPSILVEIGDYLERPAKSWISDSNEVRAGWLGGDGDNFYLVAYDYLNLTDAVRGVRLVEPRSGAP